MNFTSLWDVEPYLRCMPKNGAYYEFGVMSGKAIEIVMDIMQHEMDGQLFTKIVGFDSFEGLPKESNDVWQNPEWPEGAFNAKKVWSVNSIEEVHNCLYNRWAKYNQKNIELVTGFYCDTLNWKLAEKYTKHRASFIHIDVDLYLSTIQCMNWLFDNHLVMYNSIWRFDDWNSTPEWTAGESLAFKEVTARLGLKWKRFSDNMFQYKGTEHDYSNNPRNIP